MRVFSVGGRRVLWGVVVSSLLLAQGACTQQDPDADASALPASPDPGKEDGVGRAGLPLNIDDSTTRAWTVTNQWEDRTTAAAQQAGIAWPASSGLSWDEKYAKWMGSLDEIAAAGSSSYDDAYTTVSISTPWGKSLPSPKLDCADATIMFRASFAAWYHLPFFMVAGSNPVVYFGHFGIRTATGPWSSVPALASRFNDSSATPPTDLGQWPKDSNLRALHLHDKNADGSYQDDMPYVVGAGEGTGAYLDELHLNKRAAALIYYMQLYMGSENVVDTNNTFNLRSDALRTGDTLMYRRAPTGTGHTMVVVRVSQIDGGKLQAQDIFGNEPPDQLYFESTSATRNNFMSDEGGGPSISEDGKTPYSHIGGGLKRWRVAKAVSGTWMNTWMQGDEASWIDSTDYTAIGARPQQFAGLLGELPPLEQRNSLLAQVEDMRNHLRQYPASCAAREKREILFGQLYELMAENYNWSSDQVDQKYRSLEDYVYAPLLYTKSRTCCWNSSTSAMHTQIMAYAQSLQSNMCIMPPVFMETGGNFGAYATYAAQQNAPFPAWRADEDCPQQGTLSDTTEQVGSVIPVAYCALSAVAAPAVDPDAPAGTMPINNPPPMPDLSSLPDLGTP